MSDTPRISSEYAAYLADGHAKDQRRYDQQRILNKLAALWESDPELSFQNVLLHHVEEYFSEVLVADDRLEAELDRALAASGVKVSSGWKS